MSVAIFFKDNNSKETIINTKLTDTLLELKETIKEKAGHEPITLTFAGKFLNSNKDEMTLEQLNIKDMSVIQETNRILGGLKNE